MIQKIILHDVEVILHIPEMILHDLEIILSDLENDLEILYHFFKGETLFLFILVDLTYLLSCKTRFSNSRSKRHNKIVKCHFQTLN